MLHYYKSRRASLAFELRARQWQIRPKPGVSLAEIGMRRKARRIFVIKELARIDQFISMQGGRRDLNPLAELL